MDGGQESKLGSGPSVQIVAEELRGQQQQNPPTVSPKDQLKYLSQLFNFSVEFNDFPKVNIAIKILFCNLKCILMYGAIK